MIRRPRRALPALLVALVLLAASVTVVVSCVQVLLGQPPFLPFAALGAAAAAVSWNSAAVLATAAVVAVIGLVLLVTAVVPGQVTVLALAARSPGPSTASSWEALDTTEQLDTGTTRRGLHTSLVSAARSVDGVDRATVRIGGRSLAVQVHTPFRSDEEATTEQVRSAVVARLDEIGPARPLRVRVRTTTGSER